MGKKSLLEQKESLQKKPLTEQKIAFEFRGRKHSENVSPDLVLKDMSVSEIKDRLNEVPGKFAYWKSFLSAVDIEIETKTDAYNRWYASRYMDVVENAEGGSKKPTETALKNMVMLTYSDEYEKHVEALQELREIRGQVEAIVKAYDMQSWTLQGLARLTSQELANIEPKAKGHGSLVE